MSIQWSDNSPIYRQLKDKLVGMMLDGDIKPGDALPSVRQIGRASCRERVYVLV